MKKCELCKEPATAVCEKCKRVICIIHVNDEQASDCVFIYCTDCAPRESAEED